MLGRTVRGNKKSAPAPGICGRSKVGGFHEDLQQVSLFCIIEPSNLERIASKAQYGENIYLFDLYTLDFMSLLLLGRIRIFNYEPT